MSPGVPSASGPPGWKRSATACSPSPSPSSCWRSLCRPPPKAICSPPCFELWPSYLGYLISFATIGAIWVGHTAITHYLHAVDAGLLRLNLLLLLVVAFIPFPTGLLAENIEEPANERVAATIYGGTLLAASVVLSAVWRYALSAGLIDPQARRAELRYLTQRLAPGLAGYVGLIVLGWFRPLIAVIGYMLLAVFLLIPVRRRGRRGRARNPTPDSV